PLVEGPNSIVARAVDTLGHAAETAPATVTRDTLPPVIAITEPGPDAQLTSRTVTVRGTVSDPHLQGVTVNGVAATVTASGSGPSTFEAAGVQLPEGPSQVTAHAVDQLGHGADAAPVAVVVDTVPPAVHLDSPASPLVSTPTVTVTGTVTELHLEKVTIGSQQATVGADGAFSVVDVPLNEGRNEIRATARDTFGHETVSDPVAYELDATAPQIAITSPANGEVVTSLQIAVTGTVSDASLAGVTVNGVTATLDAGAGTFSAVVALADGANTLTAVATDRGGHTAQATVTVLLDSLPPSD